MPSTFIFGCLKLKMRFCETPFPKSIVYSNLVLGKLRRAFPSKYAEGYALKVADGLSLWALKFSRILNYSELCEQEVGSSLSKNEFQEKHENYCMTI